MTLSVHQIEAYRPVLVRLMREFVGDYAEDLSQEVLLRLWLVAGEYNLSYSVQRAKLDALTWLSRRQMESNIDGLDFPSQPEPESVVRILEAAGLDDREQEVASLVCDGLFRPEIAACITMSESGVTAIIGRVRKKLTRYYLRIR